MRALDATALTNASRALLNEGDAVGAERVLSPVIDKLRSDPAAMHLMGLIKRAQNQFSEAERYFRGAIAHAFNEGGYYNDLGVVLQAQGEFPEALKVYRAALALTPQADSTRVNIVRCLMACGDYLEAEREARTYVNVSPGPEAWTLLGQVQRVLEKFDEAVASAAAALKYNPHLRALQLNHAMALDRAGRGKEALTIYERMQRQSLDSAELALNLGRSLYAEGRKKDAEAILEQGVEKFPGAIAVHGALARVRSLRGEGESSAAIMEQVIAQRPKDLGLRLACADALHRGGHHQRALAILHEALALSPDTPALLTAFGIVLDELDRPRDGLKALRRVVELQPESPSARRNLLSTLIRAGQPEEALSIIADLQRAEPDEQYLIACQALALRVLGDPRYRELCDFDRMVRTYEIEPPRGFFTIENFNASLADTLRQQHRTNAHPLDQHLHNGTQTGRSMLGLDEPALRAFLSATEGAVRDYVSRLNPSAGDPLSRRKRDRPKYTGLWSVRLTDGGYQPNHVHDRGWISSAYYVSLLPNEKQSDPRAGWLKLGEPNRPIANCPPERFIEPRQGMLVLFPSYMWHGTCPFEGTERLSLAFDVAPS